MPAQKLRAPGGTTGGEGSSIGGSGILAPAAHQKPSPTRLLSLLPPVLALSLFLGSVVTGPRLATS